MTLKTKVLVLVFSLLIPLHSVAQSDPTAPIGFDVSKPKSKPRPKPKKAIARLPGLQAILCNDGLNCSAILNDREVTKGQSINGYVISEITENSVIVKRGDRRWSLVLFNEQVIQ